MQKIWMKAAYRGWIWSRKSDNSLSEKYIGSSAYWFKEMEKDDCNFEKCVLGVITVIDRTNAPHLESSENEKSNER